MSGLGQVCCLQQVVRERWCVLICWSQRGELRGNLKQDIHNTDFDLHPGPQAMFPDGKSKKVAKVQL